MKCKSCIPECFGKDYGLKRQCSNCEYSERCAEQWSFYAWNTQSKRGYGKSYNRGLSNEWDDLFKTLEDRVLDNW